MFHLLVSSQRVNSREMGYDILNVSRKAEGRRAGQDGARHNTGGRPTPSVWARGLTNPPPAQTLHILLDCRKVKK